MESPNLGKIKQLWQKYDEMSDKEADYFLKHLNALKEGNIGLAEYINNNILPKLKKKSYQLFLAYSREIEKLNGK